MKKPALTYCTNVHPVSDFASFSKTIPFFAFQVGNLLDWKPLPMGLWFSEAVLDAALKQGADKIRKSLEGWGATTFTFNAFPQRDFHQPVVKKDVYLPDWTQSSRLIYTQRCAALLADLLPVGGAGSISTLPLGWREDWSERHAEKAGQALVEMARFLQALHRRTGKSVALALEPEPGCALERIPQVADYWDEFLRPAAAKAGLSEALDRHVGVCYDTCHQAVQFEDPEESLGLLRDAGIAVHKMQLSSALEFPADPGGSSRARREKFAEPRFLHQTRVLAPDGVMAFDDLPLALSADPEFFAHPWRVHYHVPIHAEALEDGVRTTRDDMLRAMRYALAHDLCPHFEVETYTWSVLPEAHRPQGDEALARCLAQELDFIRRAAPEFFQHA